ncbi:methyltransferase domain-containing protein [Novosphingobium sp. Leaf2]|uniref:methyltransferase domain-containing protein n=1 Tax=Novosphingobium sp. Leaf2 TaxID=1735670 RepID=UPI0006FAC604|nr:methyltransferase domain-containing protein [Novosphingobium sp. Leaf2]KQM22130.1 biotin biosynthesis protein [Novosphingobium sp. Leaf2]
MIRADHVRRAFAAARAYDANAKVQRDVADALAARIAALDLPRSPRVLEIGCGTGFLTEALAAHSIGGTWLVTDIAPEMVDRCKARALPAHPDRQIRFAALDGEHGTPPSGPFDLICSSLAVQWFADAPAALALLARHLAPGGHLVITTLGADSFAQWRAAHEAQGLCAGTPAFVAADVFASLHPATLRVDAHVERHPNPRTFLRALKAIGAGTPAPDHRPLTPAQLRAVMARFDQSGCEVTYQVVTCHLRAATERA